MLIPAATRPEGCSLGEGRESVSEIGEAVEVEGTSCSCEAAVEEPTESLAKHGVCKVDNEGSIMLSGLSLSSDCRLFSPVTTPGCGVDTALEA